MCFLTDSIKESLRIEDGKRQALKKNCEGKVLMQEESPSMMAQDGGSMAENLFFPSWAFQRKRSDTKTKGRG